MIVSSLVPELLVDTCYPKGPWGLSPESLSSLQLGIMFVAGLMLVSTEGT